MYHLRLLPILLSEVEDMEIPDKFPPGCEFLASFSGDDFVVFPDGKVFVLDDSGESMRERSGLPRGAAPMSEANFLNSAKSNVAFNKWKAEL
jgi:hypothetical protein